MSNSVPESTQMTKAFALDTWVGVVPCYNEEKRLKPDVFLACLKEMPNLKWIFVNDGSKDDTRRILQQMQWEFPNQIQILELANNQGKAEAVRQGLLYAKKFSPWAVGYLDADLATPAHEFIRLLQVLREVSSPLPSTSSSTVSPRISSKCVLGSRMFLKGRKISRSFVRYFLSRCFIIPASILLKTRFQDTQCGAKIFLWTPPLEKSLQQKFVSRWLFDIELIYRLKSDPDQPYCDHDFFEEPLRQWTEIGESKLKPASFVTALEDLFKIFFSRKL
jgi:glycosyltransferase involved in cell wall biosynthesis